MNVLKLENFFNDNRQMIYNRDFNIKLEKKIYPKGRLFINV
ncbi:hypothetical protein KF201_1977 [Lactococcus lactis subsp. lactis]|nr:hypothetical protein KF201_1977 [Lactococcus lactis subsp. lactis]